jgi:hypothetical protein
MKQIKVKILLIILIYFNNIKSSENDLHFSLKILKELTLISIIFYGTHSLYFWIKYKYYTENIIKINKPIQENILLELEQNQNTYSNQKIQLNQKHKLTYSLFLNKLEEKELKLYLWFKQKNLNFKTSNFINKITCNGINLNKLFKINKKIIKRDDQIEPYPYFLFL